MKTYTGSCLFSLYTI